MKFGMSGSPWEFNLRDVLRWCELITHYHTDHNICPKPHGFVDLLYLQRFRNLEDRIQVINLFERIFGCTLEIPYLSASDQTKYKHYYNISPMQVQIGSAVLPRKVDNSSTTHQDLENVVLLQSYLNPLESLMHVRGKNNEEKFFTFFFRSACQ